MELGGLFGLLLLFLLLLDHRALDNLWNFSLSFAELAFELLFLLLNLLHSLFHVLLFAVLRLNSLLAFSFGLVELLPELVDLGLQGVGLKARGEKAYFCKRT